MPNIIKVQANEAGQYPVTLYGVTYLIEPVKGTAKTDTPAKPSKKPSVDPADVGQPVNDNPYQPTPVSE